MISVRRALGRVEAHILCGLVIDEPTRILIPWAGAIGVGNCPYGEKITLGVEQGKRPKLNAVDGRGPSYLGEGERVSPAHWS